MTLSISVVIMAYNEDATLKKVTQEIVSTLEGLKRDYEIIIVDDGSIDDTRKTAKSLLKKNDQIVLVSHEKNLGLGQVYRTGFNLAQSDLISFFPADGQFPPEILLYFIPLMDNHDMVLGYLPERKSPIISKILSKVERQVYDMLFGKLPKFQGVFMFRRTLLNEIPLYSTGRGWAIVLELIIKASRGNYRLTSLPTEMRPRMFGKSKVNNFRTILTNLIQAIELRHYL